MHCRKAQTLLAAERDGALPSPERAELETHLNQCADCRQVRTSLAAVVDFWRTTAARTAAPDPNDAWQEIRRELRTARLADSNSARRFASWTLPLSAAAALVAAVILVPRGSHGPESTTLGDVAHADFVEVPSNASSLVYVDDQSGWLVVWSVPEKRSDEG